MKVFVAGATGALGQRLVPMLVQAGHEVTGMTRSRPEAVRALEAEPVVADALDREAVVAAVGEARPEVVVHELTAISGFGNPRTIARDFEATNRLRVEGTDNLIAASQAAGARRLVAQSFTSWPFAREGGPVKTEDDPLDPNPPKAMRQMLSAIVHLERAVTGAEGLEGLVLRYGGFYGPGTSMAPDGEHMKLLRRRMMPIVGNGGGIWSFVHIEDAASATAAAIERGAPGIYNVVDDEPARVDEWIPALAEAAGAKPPRHVPAWLARVATGEHSVTMMTEIRGASNAKAKRELGWQLRYPSWRQGFGEVLG